jgi:organic hydroperoxide reductase OsmC/OhrA
MRIATTRKTQPTRTSPASEARKERPELGTRAAHRGLLPGIAAVAFQKTAEEAEQHCPVSKALKTVGIALAANLV